MPSMPPPPPRRKADHTGSERSGTPRPRPERRTDWSDRTDGRGWGSVARRGGRSLNLEDRKSLPNPGPPSRAGEPEWQADRWQLEESPAPAPTRPASVVRSPRAASVPRPVITELGAIVGTAQAERTAQKLADAARAYDHDRYPEALRLLRPLVVLAPTAPSVRELLGLTLYRMGRWRQAIRELEAFAELSGSFDQHPVLEDCHRALGQWRAVARSWEALRQASPSPELVAEGRIVAAEALADQGDVAAGLALLVRPSRKGRPPRVYELRLMYTQADLYERAGETPRARELFGTILRHDADFADARSRLSSLR